MKNFSKNVIASKRQSLIKNASLFVLLVSVIVVLNSGIAYAPPDNGPEPLDYSMSNSGDISVTPGGSGSNTITATYIGGRQSGVSFSISGLPSGATATFSPTSCRPTCSSTLTISTRVGTPSVSYTITVTGSGGVTTRFYLRVVWTCPDDGWYCSGTPITPRRNFLDYSCGANPGECPYIITASEVCGTDGDVCVDGAAPRIENRDYQCNPWLSGPGATCSFTVTSTTNCPVDGFYCSGTATSPIVEQRDYTCGTLSCTYGVIGTTACGTDEWICISSTTRQYRDYSCSGDPNAACSLTTTNEDCPAGYTCSGGNCVAAPCTLTSASISASCSGGASSNCEQGESITMSGTYTGDCSAADFYQIDASDVGCNIQYTGGDISGISDATITVSGGTVSGSWSIPLIPIQCGGRTVTASAGALYDGGPPGTGTWLTGTAATGSFTFAAPPPQFNFSLSNSGGITVSQGSGGSNTITATLLSGATQQVNLFASGLPAGATASFAPTSCNPNCTSTLTISTTGGTPVGNYTITVTGIGGSLTRTTTFMLTVIVPFNFTLSASPASGSVNKGGSTTTTVTATLLSGASQSVSFSCSGLPAGGSCAFAPATCNPTCSSTLTISATGATPAGTFPITISGTGGSVTRQTTYTLTVTGGLLNISVDYSDVANQLVPLTPTGYPNFTRGSNVNFLARVQVSGFGPAFECTDRDCRVFYSINNPNPPAWTEIPWSDFERGWTGNPGTSNLTCDGYHTLYIYANKTTPPGAGTNGVSSQPFFVTCTPRVTVTPVEKRVTLGQANVDSFVVIIWNPRNMATFNLQMRSPNANPFDMPIPWVHFECRGTPGCVEAGDDATLTVSGLGYAPIYVVLETAARSGSYPVRFTATAVGDPNTYRSFGAILIFAESLAEFEAWQIGALLVVAVVAYWLLSRKPKKIKIRRRR